MEDNHTSNNTIYTAYSNGVIIDMHAWYEQFTKTLILAIQPGIGLAITLTNVALLIFYKRKSTKMDITFLFLANLTGSDILFGVSFLVRFLLILVDSQYMEACRTIFVFGVVQCTLMSGWCIFLLSFQVLLVHFLQLY